MMQRRPMQPRIMGYSHRRYDPLTQTYQLLIEHGLDVNETDGNGVTPLHRAVANYEVERYRRVMHRSVVRGTVPL